MRERSRQTDSYNAVLKIMTEGTQGVEVAQRTWHLTQTEADRRRLYKTSPKEGVFELSSIRISRS